MAKRENNARPLRRSTKRRSATQRRRKGRKSGAQKGRSSSKRRSGKRRRSSRANVAGQKLCKSSNQPGQLLGEIGGEIRHNPAVEIEEYEGSELRGNPIDYREMARRFHRGGSKRGVKALKRRLLR